MILAAAGGRAPNALTLFTTSTHVEGWDFGEEREGERERRRERRGGRKEGLHVYYYTYTYIHVQCHAV